MTSDERSAGASPAAGCSPSSARAIRHYFVSTRAFGLGFQGETGGMDGRTRLSDWGRPVTGLPVRLATLTFALPIVGLCLFGMLFNWPQDCGPNGCGEPALAGSAFATGFYGAVLAVCVAGAVVFATGRVKAGGAMLLVAAALTAWGVLS